MTPDLTVIRGSVDLSAPVAQRDAVNRRRFHSTTKAPAANSKTSVACAAYPPGLAEGAPADSAKAWRA